MNNTTKLEASSPQPWRIGLWLSAGAMFLCLYFDGMGQDIEFWRTWIRQLQTGGYQALDANYPPLLLHWFRLFAWAFNAFGVIPQSDVLIKALALLPVMLSQLFLVDLVGRRLAEGGESPLHRATFWLTVFNPALLIDGPIWGQVDLLPFVPSYFAIVVATDKKLSVWTFPLFAVALLCKFQAIVFAPLIAGLTVRHWRAQLLGAPLAIAVIGAGFLPFALGGADVFEAMERAYWGNLGIYPYSTMNAANLWYLLAGGSYLPDNVSLLQTGAVPDAIVALATPAKLGLLSFAVISLVVFVSALRTNELSRALGLAVFLALGFFAFSSGMHERYLFLAVPFAALWACQVPDKRFWYPLLTVLVYLNINFVLSVAGQFTLQTVSVLVILAFLLMALQGLSGQRLTSTACFLASRAERLPRTPYAVLAFAWLGLVGWEINQQLGVQQLTKSTTTNIAYLSSLIPEQHFQEWGELKSDTNLGGRSICIVRQCYDHGLATHARSVIAYRVPDGATHFRAEAGIEREGAGGQVIFSVEVDGEERWNSGVVTSRSEPAPVDVPMMPGQVLTLKVDPLGPNFGDHAVWANAHFAR